MTKTTDIKGNEIKPLDKTFWLDGWEGKCHSGYYIRSDLFKKIAKFKEMGHRVVGIKIDESYNMEFIVEKKDEN